MQKRHQSKAAFVSVKTIFWRTLAGDIDVKSLCCVLLALVVCTSCAKRTRTTEMYDSASSQDALYGKPAPAITADVVLRPENQPPPTWQGLRGQAVVLEFWATWCGPCVAAIPHLNELADRYASKGVEFVSITDEEERIVARFLRVRPIRGLVAIDTDQSTFKSYDVRWRPQTFVIDRRGVIAAGPLHPTDLTPGVIDAALAGKPIPGTSTAQDARATARSDAPSPPAQPFGNGVDETAAVQVVVGAPGEQQFMLWSQGAYSSNSVDVSTLLQRLYGLRSPARLHWETPAPPDNVRFVGKMPDQREDLFEQLAVPALEEYLNLSIRREPVETDVYVMTAPLGPGPDLKKPEGPVSAYHRMHQTTGEGYLFAAGNYFEWLVEQLEQRVHKPIIDETGFDGLWCWALKFEEGNTASIVRAAHEQLGLVLTPQRKKIDMVVIRQRAGDAPPSEKPPA